MATTSTSWITSKEPETIKQRLSILSPVWYKRSPGALGLFRDTNLKKRTSILDISMSSMYNGLT